MLLCILEFVDALPPRAEAKQLDAEAMHPHAEALPLHAEVMPLQIGHKVKKTPGGVPDVFCYYEVESEIT